MNKPKADFVFFLCISLFVFVFLVMPKGVFAANLVPLDSSVPGPFSFSEGLTADALSAFTSGVSTGWDNLKCSFESTFFKTLATSCTDPSQFSSSSSSSSVAIGTSSPATGNARTGSARKNTTDNEVALQPATETDIAVTADANTNTNADIGDVQSGVTLGQVNELINRAISNAESSMKFGASSSSSPVYIVENSGGGVSMSAPYIDDAVTQNIGPAISQIDTTIASDIANQNGSVIANGTFNGTFSGPLITLVSSNPATTTNVLYQNGGVLYWNGSPVGAGGGSGVWGSILGTLSNQTDLQNALNQKLSLSAWYSTTTDALAEGVSHLYYTTARATAAANAAIDATTSLPNITTLSGLTSAPNIALNASNISSGTIAVSQGGTGTSTAPALNQLLIGNGSGGYSYVSTSSLGISGGGGTNYFANSSATTSLSTGSILAAGTGTFGTVNATSTTGTSTFSGGIKLTNLASAFLAVDSSGNVVSTTTPGFGTVTSVGLSVPTGLSISGSPVTTSGTLALSLTSGYVIPLTASATQWSNLVNASATLPYYIGVGTTSVNSITTLPSLSLPASQVTGLSTNYFTNSSATTSLTTGSILTALTGTFGTINATSTTGTSTFAGGLNVSGQTTFATASSTGLTVTATSTLTGVKLTNLSNTILAVDANGDVIATTSSGSGTVNSGTAGQVAFYNTSGTAVSGTSTLFFSGGNIGIGTTTPGSLLSVAGNGYFGGNVMASGTLTVTATSTLTGLKLTNLASTFLAVDANGNVIATTSLGGGTNYFTNSSATTSLSTGSILSAGTGTFGVINSTSTATSSFNGDILIAGSIVPTTNDVYSLGASSSEWANLYVGPGSIYVNGQEVLHTDPSQNVNVTADTNESLIMQTSGTGNIELNPSGSGQILLQGNVLLSAGDHFTNSNAGPIAFIGGIAADNLQISGNTIQATNTNGGIILAATGTGGVYFTQGNVGIGTTTPGYLLTVAGNGYFGGNVTASGTLTVTATSTLTGLKLTNLASTILAVDASGNVIATTTPGGGTNYFSNSSATTSLTTGTILNAPTGTFGTLNATNTLTVTATTTLVNGLTIGSFQSGTWINLPTTGPSGIGTGGAGANPFLAYVSVNGNWFTDALAGDSAYRNTTGSLRFGGTSNGSQFVISSTSEYFQNGNVGIGSSTPSARLSVQNAYGSTTPLFDIATTTSSAFATSSLFRVNANGNIGIGTTTPGSLLTVAGGINLTGALAVNGSTGSNGYVLESTGSGLQWVATSTLGISGGAGGSATYGSSTLASTYNPTSSYANVGLSVTLPVPGTYMVQATARVAVGSSANDDIILRLYDSTAGSVVSDSVTMGGYLSSGLQVTAPIEAYVTTVSNNEVINLQAIQPIGSGGQVAADGNGGTSMTYLRVDNIATSGSGGSGGSGTVNTGSAGQVAFYNSSGTAVSGTSTLFFSGGNVGIGTTTPDTLLHVYGNSNNNLGLLELQATAGGSNNNAGISFVGGGSSGNSRNWQISNNYSNYGDLDFLRSTSATGNPTTPVMSLDLNGNVGIGTTTPGSALDVGGNITDESLKNCDSSTNAIGTTASGTLVCDTSLSDERLKNDITSLDGQDSLNLIDSLNPVSFYWKDPSIPGTGSTQQQFGFIAQQVQIVAPNLVGTTTPTYLTPDQTYYLNYQGIIAPLVAAVQEQEIQILSIASSTATSSAPAYAQASDLDAVEDTVNLLTASDASTSATLVSLSSTTAALQSQVAAIASTTASTTAATLSASQSFLQTIANSVLGLIQASGELVSSAATWTVGGIHSALAVFTDVQTQTIEAQTASVSGGINMTDTITGSIYCVRMTDGALTSTLGNCASLASSTVVVVTPSTPVTTTTPDSTGTDSEGQDQTQQSQTSNASSSTASTTAATSTPVVTDASSSDADDASTTVAASSSIAVSTSTLPAASSTPSIPAVTNSPASSSPAQSGGDSGGSAASSSVTTPPPAVMPVPAVTPPADDDSADPSSSGID